LANENPASDQLEEKVDETNYPGAPESQDVEGKESSQPEQAAIILLAPGIQKEKCQDV
jgi:hypothetical protein